MKRGTEALGRSISLLLMGHGVREERLDHNSRGRRPVPVLDSMNRMDRDLLFRLESDAGSDGAASPSKLGVSDERAHVVLQDRKASLLASQVHSRPVRMEGESHRYRSGQSGAVLGCTKRQRALSLSSDVPAGCRGERATDLVQEGCVWQDLG